MDKSRQEKLARALEMTVSAYKDEAAQYPERLEKKIRRRVWELLEESGLYYSHKREPTITGKGSHFIEIIDPLRFHPPMWAEYQVSDSDLAEKEQDLIIWLTGKLKKKEGRK